MKANATAEAHHFSLANGKQAIQTTTHIGAGINATAQMEQGREKIYPKQKPKDLMMWYANSLFAVAFSGGFAVLPAIALGGVFSKIGATNRTPQFAAVILLLACYLSDFVICSFIPKCTFSSLLVFAAIDLMHSWFIKSYQKSATEWVVVPLIVATSLRFGMLGSVGVGLAASTLIFVASFYRAGVVKYIANGLTVRSTIERDHDDSLWLDSHGDWIQLLVLQNYIFFGNANSSLKYIQSMFDEEVGFDEDLPPIPKVLILDMTIVTGIDTSAVDGEFKCHCFMFHQFIHILYICSTYRSYTLVIAEICTLCRENQCSLILAGIPQAIRPALISGGVKPSRVNKHLSFSVDLDAALGKAEDDLLKAADVGGQQRYRRKASIVDNAPDHGLRYALEAIDAQHNLKMSRILQSLEQFTDAIELNAGDNLNYAGSEHLPRGLYFVEEGLIKCEYDSSASLTRGRTSFFAAPHLKSATESISQLKARTPTVGRCANILKKNPGAMLAQNHVFRLARIGPGWVIGAISDFIGDEIPGTYTALTPCRLHHLTFETIDELEVDQPVLILHLYKLLSRLSARRQEMTITQLATLRSIMSATAPTKPISRRKMRGIQQHF